MSYKLGLMLSMVFVAMFFLFGIDMINIQFMYTDLDQKAISIGYLIAKQGNTDNLIDLENQFDCKITCLENCTPKFGDVIKFEVKDSFQPLIISKQVMYVHVQRSAVIGYYD